MRELGGWDLICIGGGEPLASSRQVLEESGRVGQVGDVGAKVAAASAAELDHAGPADGRCAGGPGATAVGNGDPASSVSDRHDSQALMTTVQYLAPDGSLH
jgi:hypothetical protein